MILQQPPESKPNHQRTTPKPKTTPNPNKQMRGSTVDDDWSSNFHYPFCTEEESEDTRIPGRVHGGFLKYVQSLIPQVDAEMERVRPWKVSLAGDSLGGAVANLMGAYIARVYEGMLTEKVGGVWGGCVIVVLDGLIRSDVFIQTNTAGGDRHRDAAGRGRRLRGLLPHARTYKIQRRARRRIRIRIHIQVPTSITRV